MSLKKNKAAADGQKKSKTTAANIRIQKGNTTHFLFDKLDLGDLDTLPSTMKLEFPDANDVFNFNLVISPDQGKCQEEEKG